MKAKEAPNVVATNRTSGCIPVESATADTKGIIVAASAVFDVNSEAKTVNVVSPLIAATSGIEESTVA